MCRLASNEPTGSCISSNGPCTARATSKITGTEIGRCKFGVATVMAYRVFPTKHTIQIISNWLTRASGFSEKSVSNLLEDFQHGLGITLSNEAAKVPTACI